MFRVKVFDGNGKLKEVISAEEVSRISDENFFQAGAFSTRTVKKYVCAECKINFKSMSARTVKYCEGCRNITQRKRKRKERLSEIKN